MAALYGLMAEYKDADTLVSAAATVTQAGYKRTDAYSPFPVHGIDDAMNIHDPLVSWIVFIAGVTGMIFGYALQWWVNTKEYPLNVGGRPFHSWPSFIPVTFECTILFAAFGAVLAAILLNGLPKPYHPVFNAPRFELASQDRFFLCIEANDPKFEIERTWQLLKDTGARAVSEVQQ